MSASGNQLSPGVQSSVLRFGVQFRNRPVSSRALTEGVGKFFERELRQWLTDDPDVPDPGSPGSARGADFPNYNVDVKAVKKDGSGLRGSAAIYRPTDPIEGLEYGLLVVAYTVQQSGSRATPLYTVEDVVFVPRKFTADANRSQGRHIDFASIRAAYSEGRQALADAVSTQLDKLTSLLDPRSSDIDDFPSHVEAGVVKFRAPNPRWTLDFSPAFERDDRKAQRIYERSPADERRITGKRKRRDDDGSG